MARISPHPSPPPQAEEAEADGKRNQPSPACAGGSGPLRRSGRVGATVAEAIEKAGKELSNALFDDPRRRARRLLAMALGWSAAEVFAHPERALDAAQQARVEEMLHRMLAHEPVSRIVGVREFWGLEFLLSADTLDPRPETETVVEAVLQRLPHRTGAYRFLDLGTGTGCILLALLSEFPQATGLGIDIAPDAARTARINAERLGLRDRAWFAVGSWGQCVAGHFDVVAANPPYIPAPDIARLPPEVRDYDPRRALDGGPDGLAAYRAIAADLPRLLAPAGFFASEIGASQAGSVVGILVASGLRPEGIVRDLAGLPRCVVADAGAARNSVSA